MCDADECVCGSVHLVLHLRVLLISLSSTCFNDGSLDHSSYLICRLVVETCSTAQPVPSLCPSVEHETLP